MTVWALLLFIICAVALLITISTVITGISPLPSSRSATQSMMKMIPPGSKVYDLGSGWGTLCFAAGRIENSKVVGIESSIVPFLFSKLSNVIRRNKVTSVINGNIHSENISDADVVLCYLYTEAMEKLAENIRERVSPGTIIISNTFALPRWTPVETIKMNDLYGTMIYRYVC